jgi:hypothetical protein
MSYFEKKENLLKSGYSEEEINYAISLLNQGVMDHQVVNSLRAMRKMENDRAVLLVRELQKEDKPKTTSGGVLALCWIFGIIIMAGGLIRMNTGSPFSGTITMISGMSLIISAASGVFRR